MAPRRLPEDGEHDVTYGETQTCLRLIILVAIMVLVEQSILRYYGLPGLI